MVKKGALLSCLVLGLSGCASISEDQCRLGDWYAIGLQDGFEGEPNKAAKYSGDCAEYKVAVDNAKYVEGRNEGLKSFCNYDNGVYIGSQNKSYNQVCPADLSGEFLAGYLPYKKHAEAESSLSSAKTRLNDLRNDLKEKDLSEKEEKSIKSRIKSQKQEVKRKKSELSKAEYQLALHKVDRRLAEIQSMLEQDGISAAKKESLQARVVALEEQRAELEEMYSVDSTIRNIKEIIDLFK